jgi:hypothetical protein
MSVRPKDNLSVPTPEAIWRWWPAPTSFTEDERTHWEELGRRVKPLKTVSEADKPFCELVARYWARVDREMLNPNIALTALNAATGRLADMFGKLGLNPQDRRTTAVLPDAAKPDGEEKPRDEF